MSIQSTHDLAKEKQSTTITAFNTKKHRQLEQFTQKLQQCEVDLKNERITAIKVRTEHVAAVVALETKLHQAETTIAEFKNLPPPPPPPPPVVSIPSTPPPPTTLLPSSSSTTTVDGNKAWLTIGLPTVPRQGGIDYLTPTITSYLEQISDDPADPLYGKVRIVIMNQRPGEHPLFDTVRTQVLASDKGRAHVFFVENNNPGADATPDKRDKGTPDLPGYKVRKQTRDLVSLLQHNSVMKTSEYYLFSEDDMRLCEHGLIALRYLINRATFFRKNWLAVRISYGMNGILMRNNAVSSLCEGVLWGKS
jgi:hypothetical protein